MAQLKDRRYGNRGMPLENFIRFANDQYLRRGLAVITKQPTEFIPIRDAWGKIVSTKVEHKSTVDFIGRYAHRPIAIEAKNTNTDSIRFDAVQEHQAAFMDQFTAQPGTIGLVVVSFNQQRFFAIPWTYWQAAYNARVRPGGSRTSHTTVKAAGYTWTIPEKFSIRMDEIPPLFEVSGKDTTFGLHYLENAERYVTPPQP